MYVVLDTEVIVSDPSCSGNVWTILAHVSDSWGLKIVVPEVVITEAVACYEREISDIHDRIEGTAKSKRFRALGVESVRTVALNELEAQSQGYRNRLTQRLLDLGAIFVPPPPSATHSQLVQRAANRRKPCDSKGDGYRDTLNWLTILDLLGQHDEDVAWVSNNTKDFGAEDADPGEDGAVELHPQLVEELDAAGHTGRVRYSRDLGKLVMSIASELAPGLPQDMRGLIERVREDTLVGFVGTFLEDQLPKPVDPESLALPLYANFATIAFIANVKDLAFDIAGSAGDGSAIVTFSGVCSSAIEVGIPDGNGSEFESDEQSLGVITKELKYEGFLILDSLGKPQSGELTAVNALENDPGREEWARLRMRAALLRRLRRQAPARDMTSDAATKALGAEFVRSLLEKDGSLPIGTSKVNEDLVGEFLRTLGADSLSSDRKRLKVADDAEQRGEGADGDSQDDPSTARS
jgi:hypothetical protein